MADYDRNIPYNNLPDIPPKADVETKTIMHKTIAASRVLAQLNGAILNLPNPTIFIDTIYLQEAKASSEIENIITTNDALYQSVVSERKYENPAEKEVVNYKQALWHGMKHIEQRPFISTNLCIEIMQCIRQNTDTIRRMAGTTLRNSAGDVIYTPPEGENVIREKLRHWETFINAESSIDPLIKMALMHYQFEAIHPFADGNGRTGRILLLLFLKLYHLLDIPAIYLSDYIIKNKVDYYGRLRCVTEFGEWEQYVLFMLDMVEVSAKNGLLRLQKIKQTMDELSQQIKSTLPKIYSMDLVETLFRLPYCKRQTLIDAGFGTTKTVGNYLLELESHGFLQSTRVGKEKLYLNKRLLDILDDA